MSYVDPASACEFYSDRAVPPQCGASDAVKYKLLYFSPHSPDSRRTRRNTILFKGEVTGNDSKL